MASTSRWRQLDRTQRSDINWFFIKKYLVMLRRLPQHKSDKGTFETSHKIRDTLANFERELAKAARMRADMSSPSSLPKTIFILWQQGWDQAPEIVHLCAQSWKKHNPDWDVRLLSETDLCAQIPEYAELQRPFGPGAARSNMARLALLKNFGGVWADATTYCHRPLTDWLPPSNGSGFFALHKPRPYREIDIWFLAAEKDNALVSALYELCGAYWRNYKSAHHYYWMEYLFEYMLARDSQLRAVWAASPKISAKIALMFGRHALDVNASPWLLKSIEANQVPFSKLSHKWKFDGDFLQTPIAKLTGMSQL